MKYKNHPCHPEALTERSTQPKVLISSPLWRKGRTRGVGDINAHTKLQHLQPSLTSRSQGREQKGCHPESAGRRIQWEQSLKSGFFAFAQNDGSMEQGRSMVEMLGTLAIMGVLSVGAIAGFNYAMNKHRANEILDEARKRAYTVMTQTQLGLTRSLGEYSRHNTFAGGTFASEIVTTGLRGQFGLKVSEVKKPVCQRLLEAVNNNVILRWVATPEQVTVPLTTCSDIGDYVLVYNNDMTGKETDPEYCQRKSDCASACDDCIDGVCQENCAAGEECVIRPEKTTPISRKICCPNERVMNGVCCTSVKYDADTGKELCCMTSTSYSCCPEGKFAGNGGCYSCDEDASVSTATLSGNTCRACQNRVLTGWNCALQCRESDQIPKDGLCYCPNDKPLQDVDSGKCYTCDEAQIKNKRGYSLALTFYLKELPIGANNLNCSTAMFCGNMMCVGGYVWPCAAGQIGYTNAAWNFNLTDGTPAVARSTNPTECYSCADVDVSSVKLESQCKICGGSWSGSNWYTGTCTPGTSN